ncbi:hypothetical protein EAL2_c10780 [Peptoclostridium acidaminophilum DSM 3953]|uniref:Uncharacterized protein n=1 Tax=Peptoclostridium acidaminophilum DSM 3953 TaxID=1286171 RepID=W8U626_PEPAC|nr:hypothetical protein [Peptoclostridium acidaminophilum]AHM56376.1 hypothetical protein EAL2_c10780 [Peptoclostridium acidaminophilum DSM 3953]
MSDERLLPVLHESMLPFISQITNTLGVERTVLASDDEIQYAWKELPRELLRIPPELRDELLARMCVAVSTGLFDGAINYIWNASIRNLRNKVKDFGYNVVAHILSDNFDEKKLNNLKDAELLCLCLKLNLISEEGFFFLDQCRDIRNNFSAAHPSIAFIDDRELIFFISRCSKYALSSVINLKGVDINSFATALKGGQFTTTQLNLWISRLKETHDAQREMLFGMLHGVYCDPSSAEQSRINALNICMDFASDFTPQIKLNLTDKHYEYQAKGDEKRHSASLKMFEKLGLLNCLSDMEVHHIFSNACNRLYSVHMSYDNFYNEPPFAERLFELSLETEIPDTIKPSYVYTILICYVGNRYGTSSMAEQYYEDMIKNFTPKEISILLDLLEMDTKSILADRLKTHPRCKEKYVEAIKMINISSIGGHLEAKYNKILKK